VTAITCAYATARPCYDMIGRPNDDHLQLFLDALAAQTFTDFEVVIADCIYDRREAVVEDNTYRGKRYPFTIRHVQVHSPWLQHGCWSGQSPWNHALLLAQGELFLTFGDCCELPPDYLQRIWMWYLQGYWCMGLVVYKKGGDVYRFDERDYVQPAPDGDTENWRQGIRKNLQELHARGILQGVVKDSRWPLVERSGTLKLAGRGGHQQYHGYCATPLQALLAINGFDENIDGSKALGDVWTGIQLHMAGYDHVLVLDENVWLYENAHQSVPEDVLWYHGPEIRSNYSLMCLNERVGRWRSNSYRLTAKEVDWIIAHSQDWGFQGIDQKANPLFQKWLHNPPLFDVKELRWGVQDVLDDDVIELPKYYVWDE